MGTRAGSVPPEMRALRRWVGVEIRDGRKVPVDLFGTGNASATDPGSWYGFEQAVERMEEGAVDWLGFVLADDGIVGIDIDHCVDRGIPDDEALEAIRACGSYAELSVSGEGVHIFCKGGLPFDGRKVGGWEAYKDRRYFLVTGRQIGRHSLAEAQAGIDAVVEGHLRLPEVGGGDSYTRAIWEPKMEVRRGRPRLVWPDVESGGRHLALVSFCGRLVGTEGLERDYIAARTMEMNAAHMRPPLPDEEVLSIVDSCMRYRR